VSLAGQIDGPLGAFAPLAGVNSVSLAAAVLSGLVALAVMDSGAALRRWLPAVAAIAGIGLLVGRITWTEPAGELLRVLIIQPDVRAEKRFELDELQPQLDLLAGMTLDALAHQSANLVFWPETAIPARIDQVEPFLAGLRDAMAVRGAEVVTGIVSRERAEGGWHYYNSAITSSQPRQEYRKRRLLPFTEYLPDFMPEEWRRARHADATGVLSPGAEGEGVMRLGAVTAGVTICWETSYAAVVNSVPNVHFLVSLSNDDWFRSTSMPGYALEMARMRAKEAGRDMVRAANSGISAVMAADGSVTARAPALQRTTLRGTIQPRAGLTPYVRFGDAALWITIMLMLVCSAVMAVRKRAAGVQASA
jgi:apolipoprotein N-acyltransferase